MGTPDGEGMESMNREPKWTGDWTIVLSEEALDQALDLAKGDYQENFLLGHENLSGSTLKGKAKHYGATYSRSRGALLKRMTDAGIPWTEERGDHNKRILVIGRRETGLRPSEGNIG
jgi:hypothetical protein